MQWQIAIELSRYSKINFAGLAVMKIVMARWCNSFTA